MASPEDLRRTLVRFALVILVPLAIGFPILWARKPELFRDPDKPYWADLTSQLAFEGMLVSFALILWFPATRKVFYPLGKLCLCILIGFATGWQLFDLPRAQLLAMLIMTMLSWPLLPRSLDGSEARNPE